jgi:hypothetical protein
MDTDAIYNKTAGVMKERFLFLYIIIIIVIIP